MPKMNPTSQKVLKITHLFFVCLWVGGACTLALLKQGVHCLCNSKLKTAFLKRLVFLFFRIYQIKRRNS